MKHPTRIPWGVLGRWLVVATPYRIANFLVPIATVYVAGARYGYRSADLLTSLVPLGEIAGLSLVAVPSVARSNLAMRLGAMTIGAVALASIGQGAPWPIGAVGALVVGASATIVTGELRRALTLAIESRELGRALSVDSVAQEVTWLVAPSLATALVAFGLRSSLLEIVAASALVATLLARSINGPRHGEQSPSHLRALLARGRWLWTLSGLEGVLEGGAVLAAVPLALADHHAAVAGGLSLTLMTVGSISGGIAWTRWAAHRRTSLAILAGLVSLLAVAIALWATLAATLAWWLSASVLAGAAIAPINAVRTSLVSQVIDEADLSGAYAVLYGTYSVGWLVVGTAEAALLGILGARGAEIAGAAFALGTSLLAVLRARTSAAGWPPQ